MKSLNVNSGPVASLCMPVTVAAADQHCFAFNVA